jgi:hypothetical protein
MTVNANKVDSRLTFQMAQQQQNSSAVFACIFKVGTMTQAEKQELSKMNVTFIAGNIYTARLTAADIDALSNKHFVITIQGSGKVGPANP